MHELVVTLPVPPSANGFYSIYSGRKILSKRARLWHAAVAPLLDEAKGTVPPGWPCDAAYVFTYWLTPPTRRRVDIDGPLKALLDACTRAEWIWADDCQVQQVHAYKMPVFSPGGVTIKITVHQERSY